MIESTTNERLSLGTVNGLFADAYQWSIEADMDRLAFLSMVTIEYGPWRWQALDATIDEVCEMLWTVCDEESECEAVGLEIGPSFVVMRNGHRLRVTVGPA